MTLFRRNLESTKAEIPVEKCEGEVSKEFGRKRCTNNRKTKFLII